MFLALEGPGQSGPEAEREQGEGGGAVVGQEPGRTTALEMLLADLSWLGLSHLCVQGGG